MPRIPQPPSLESKSLRFVKKDPMAVACNEKNVPLRNNWCADTNDGS
jgi:hypothetical protein